MPAYFFGQRLLATTNRLPMWDETTLASDSQVFICPTCGDAWGRIAMEGAATWLPIRRGCSKHPWIEDVGGTFIPPWIHGCPDWLPPEVIRHELQIRLNQNPEETR